MTIRHASALALVGWYLMTPPALPDTDQNHGAPVYTDINAPISRWETIESFDEALACQNSLRQHLERIRTVRNCDTIGGPVCRGFKTAKCIATDDPRLKPK